ncbi:MAG TPA: hypothetical protein VLB46_18070 [Pyrinomonadaceae bacterium]|nr:hypothetical protein [Pyrinomonadaceae bacterium]
MITEDTDKPESGQKDKGATAQEDPDKDDDEKRKERLEDEEEATCS